MLQQSECNTFVALSQLFFRSSAGILSIPWGLSYFDGLPVDMNPDGYRVSRDEIGKSVTSAIITIQC